MRRRSKRPTSENRSSAGNRMCMCASSEPQGELHASRRLNSRRSSSIASTSCTNTDATDNHHSQRSSKDRKSTRLNSSHQIISYAVFCLKKKKKKQLQCNRPIGTVSQKTTQ